MSNNMKKYVTYWMVAMLFVPISVLAANFTREDNCKELYRIYDYECEMNENYHETDFSMAAQRIFGDLGGQFNWYNFDRLCFNYGQFTFLERQVKEGKIERDKFTENELNEKKKLEYEPFKKKVCYTDDFYKYLVDFLKNNFGYGEAVVVKMPDSTKNNDAKVHIFGKGSGISVEYYFKRVNGKWTLLKKQDSSM